MPDCRKMVQSSAACSAGAGDISERELSRERSNLFTPPARLKRGHPKKLFSTPVSKFTATPSVSSSNLARIRSCLNEYKPTSARKVKICPKAASMEDLTPIKRIKRETKDNESSLNLPPLHGEEEQAAAKIGTFMLVASWRRRRDEIRCVRKTLEFQVSCSERLRVQVFALKALLDSDNAKVRLAMKELERLKQLLHDKELEKAVLEKEKHALEQDVCAAEDRASEMSINWRNCRNELECERSASACCERALALERAAIAEARQHCERAYIRISTLEEELAQHETLLSESEAQVVELRRELGENQRVLELTREELKKERESRERSARECSVMSIRIALSGQETQALSAEVEELRAQLSRLDNELRITREQLEWWPRPLTRMLGAARSWLRHPMSLPEALLWTLIPARHGC